MERRVINHITNNSNIHSNNKVEVFKNENHHHQGTKEIVSQHKEKNTLYTDNIYTENICEDTKSDIKLLDIHLPHNNLVHNDSGESQDNNKVVEDDEDLDEELEEDIVSQHSEHSEEEPEPVDHENMVTEMRVKRNNSSDGGGMIEKPVKCYKSRSLINRNRSPPCSGNALSKLREELSKPVLSKRSSKTGEQQQQSEQQQQQSQTSQPQINNENSNVEASSSMKPGDNRRSRHRKNRINAKRKRLCSGNSMLSNNSSNDCKKSKVSFVKRDTILTTEQMYCTQMGSSSFSPSEDKDSPLDSASTTTNLEVPSWRIKVFTSCYSMEGTENLDDDVFNKRHLRLENDERRRKRWDVQRIREQRHIEKLKQRQERVGSGGRTDDHISEPPNSLWPSLDDIKYIEITEHLPVTAFGVPIAQFTPSEFSLPWLNESSNSNNNTSTNIPSTKKSKKKSSRRRSNKR
ncbi:male-specific lethal 1-like 1 isoform X2 [Chrysoperla carnea]|nr:male-specific lethal 1-like 1 isoform X2 [Chrysoperla carnea]